MRGGLGESRRQSRGDDRCQIQERRSFPLLQSPPSIGRRDKNPGVGGRVESCSQQPKVLGGDGDDDVGDDGDIYIMMKCLCVCHEKGSSVCW